MRPGSVRINIAADFAGAHAMRRHLREGRRADPQALHAVALRCKRLADETNDREAKAALDDLAHDYARRTDEAQRLKSERRHKRGM